MQNIIKKREGPSYNEIVYIPGESGPVRGRVVGRPGGAKLLLGDGRSVKGKIKMVATTMDGGMAGRATVFKGRGIKVVMGEVPLSAGSPTEQR